MKPQEMMKEVREFMNENVAPVLRFTSVANKGNYWEVGTEVVEEKDYMRRYGRDQIVGSYLVRVNSKGEVTSFHRTGLRQRTSTDLHEEEEEEEA
ncbi:gas vesicle protein GvpO [Alkalicoccus urumqiensis]|uniref:Gas vesicle protein GvpR n=1 Tax=Alkalicoccus urumqiensis TaxID=1548213 RepID=A0A2P6MIR0_ALKUR|nr:gas vesicle protein GvpO [Alkalicoccus urumqiensis]PRO66185.1 gas vesicle protein GvpR [Alkalicoccus urumqiensis]